MLPPIPAELEARIREPELKWLHPMLAGPRSLLLVGSPGVGKSVVLRRLRSALPDTARCPYVDVSSPSCRTRLGLASSVMQDAPESAGFHDAAARARLDGSAKTTRDAISAFADYLRDPEAGDFHLCLDNVDQASDRTLNWLIQVVRESPKVKLVATARSAANLSSDFNVQTIDPFTLDQVRSLCAYWSSSVGVEKEAFAIAAYRLSGGNAVSVCVAAWAIQGTGNPASMQAHSTQSLLYEYCSRFERQERELWAASVACKHRITNKILELLAAVSEPLAADHYSLLATLPFTAAIQDTVGGVVVHSLAQQFLIESLSLSRSDLRGIHAKLVSRVYPRLMGRDLDPAALLALFLERLSYLTQSDLQGSSKELQEAFLTAARNGNVARVDELAKLAEDALLRNEESAPMALRLMVAEAHLIDHQPKHAEAILSGIKPQQLLAESSLLRVRHSILTARLSTSPCPLKGESVFDAISLLKSTLETAKATGDADLVAQVQVELGNALRLAARNREAIAEYEVVATGACHASVRVRALEEQAQVYRLMQRLEDATESLARANALRFEFELHSTGVPTYYTANILRDGAEFSRAAELYARAEIELGDLGDEHNLCCLYGDQSWMYYLRGDPVKAEALSDKAKEIATFFGFGRELAEFWHARYHYCSDREEWEAAWKYLDQALVLAKEYGNVVIELDCLMHQVQRQAKLGDVAGAYQTIADMKAIELKGAGIAVFRGRAQIYLADELCEKHDYFEAYGLWKDGFETVGRFGNTRSNVDQLEDMARRSIPKLRLAEQTLNQAEAWPPSGLMAQVPALQIFFSSQPSAD